MPAAAPENKLPNPGIDPATSSPIDSPFAFAVRPRQCNDPTEFQKYDLSTYLFDGQTGEMLASFTVKPGVHGGIRGSVAM